MCVGILSLPSRIANSNEEENKVVLPKIKKWVFFVYALEFNLHYPHVVNNWLKKDSSSAISGELFFPQEWWRWLVGRFGEKWVQRWSQFQFCSSLVGCLYSSPASYPQFVKKHQGKAQIFPHQCSLPLLKGKSWRQRTCIPHLANNHSSSLDTHLPPRWLDF